MSELLGQPEYLHVLLNPVLTHALPVAAVGLLLALVFQSPPATRLSLLLVFLSSAAVWPAVHYGHAGYDRVLSMADDTGGDWLKIHMYRAESWEWIFYATAIVALTALIAPRKWPKCFLPMSWTTGFLAIAACIAAVHVASPAGKVRHREFREGRPPAAEVQKAQAAEPDD